LNAKHHEKEAQIIANAGKMNTVTIATSMAGRGQDIKLGGKQIDKNDNSTLEEKNKVKTLGGLFVIGSERHESRRIDNQLRGRAGRQGDQGNSIFYISLQDDLMRIFGSESIDTILKKFGLKENESIDHPWINKALERAQQKVEARNYDIRKTLLKFDDVMNDQRKVIFSQRKEILSSSSLSNLTTNFLNELIDQIIQDKKIIEKDPKNKSVNIKIKSLLGRNINEEEITNLINMNDENFKKYIVDKFIQQRLKRVELMNDEQNNELERRIFIQTLDMNWKSHLQYLEQLRQVIGLRGYGQRDPLIEYKKEAFGLFEKLLEKIKIDVLKSELILSSNLAITRCGASTTAELVQTLTPFIAVPLPHSIDNHQYLNAKYYANKGCCLFLEQDNFDTENLFNLIMETIKNENKLENIRKNMKKNYNKNVYSNIENEIKEFI